MRFQVSFRSHESEGELAESERSWTRWRSMGERRGSRAGGGRVEANAVGRQASKGGRRLCGGGGGIDSAIGVTGVAYVSDEVDVP